MRQVKASIVAAVSLATYANGKGVSIDAMRHDIQQVHAGNIDGVLATSLPLTVSACWYFSSKSSDDAAFIDTWNEVAKSNKKMLKVVAFDCDDGAKAKKQCERVGVKSTPHIRIYPQSPQPHFEYQGEKTTESINKLLRRLMGDKVQSFTTADEFSKFKNGSPTKQKIVLFSDKKKFPAMLKGLSTDTVFARTVEFGFVGEVGKGGLGDEIAKAAGKNAQKPPMLMMVSKGKTMYYGHKKSQDMKDYLGLHEWININSESGMGDKVKDASGEEAPEVEVEVERVREIHGKNSQEMCFKQKNICAIYLQKGLEMDDKVADMVQGFERDFEPKNDRGIRFSWMWANAELQTDLVNQIEAQEKKSAAKEDRDVEPMTYPTMIMVKPARKKREEKFFSYVRLGQDVKVAKESVKQLVEKVSGGATYQKADPPKFIVKPAAPKKEKKKEEL